jgi:hypothetical protein
MICAASVRATKRPFSVMNVHMSFEVFLIVASINALFACKGTLIERGVDPRVTPVDPALALVAYGIIDSHIP